MRTPAPADLQRWSDEVARDPRSLAFLPLARAYRKQSLSDAAMQLCLRGLESYPSHVEAHGLLAVLHAEQGDRQRAADEWSIVLRLDRDNFEALRGLGFCYLEEDRLSKARQMLERAALLRPADPAVREALRLLGSRQDLTERGVAAKPHAQDVASSGTQPAAATDAAPAGAEPWLESTPPGALTDDPGHETPASDTAADPWQYVPPQGSAGDPWHDAPPPEPAGQPTQRAARQWEFAEPPQPGERPREHVGEAAGTVPETPAAAAAREDIVIELLDPVAEGQEPGAQRPEAVGAPKESVARQWEFAAEPHEPVRPVDGAREGPDLAPQAEVDVAPGGTPNGQRTAADVTDPGELFAELLATGPVLAVLLVDARGLVLAGGMTEGVGGDAAMLGAVLGGAAGEAARTVAHLSLGEWQGVLLEADTALLHLTPVGDEAVLVLAARHSTPAGWMRRAAAQAVERAHPFLEAYR